MIRDIFLPEKINSYYLFPKRVIACELTRFHAKLTSVKIQGKKRMIEKIIDKQIIGDITLSYAERAAASLTEVVPAMGKYDEFYVIVPCNLTITKELTLPFDNVDKIKLVLPFEIEPLLPFPLSQATADCIINTIHDHSSNVLAVAIKNDVLAEQISIFEQANIQPTRVSIDLIELFALFKALNPKNKQHVVLLYIGLQTTRIGIIIGGQLKSVRSLSQGIIKLGKIIGTETEHILQVGLPEATGSEHAKPFFADILFTLQPFELKMAQGQKFEKVLLMGLGADIQGLPLFVENIMQIPCEAFQVSSILHQNLAITDENHGIPNDSIISVTSALSLPVSEEFNLYKAPHFVASEKLFMRQIIAVASLLFLIVASLLLSGFLNARKLKQEIQASENEAVSALKKEFPTLTSRAGATGLDAVKNAARAEVAREKSIWFALSAQNRTSFLRYLQELFTRLDPIGLGLNLTRLALTDDTMTIEGSVKDYEALKQLEENLRQSKLFSNVPRLQERTFTAKITLDNSQGEG